MGYIVSSPGGGVPYPDCDCEFPIFDCSTKYTKPTVWYCLQGLENKCFAWLVTARCADGSTSQASAAVCYPNNGHGGGSPKSVTNATVSPNPTSGEMTFTIDTNFNTPVRIEIYNFNGILIKSFTQEVTKNSTSTLSWNANGVLPKKEYILFNLKQHMKPFKRS